jgi:hypothetical protein
MNVHEEDMSLVTNICINLPLHQNFAHIYEHRNLIATCSQGIIETMLYVIFVILLILTMSAVLLWVAYECLLRFLWILRLMTQPRLEMERQDEEAERVRMEREDANAQQFNLFNLWGHGRPAHFDPITQKFGNVYIETEREKDLKKLEEQVKPFENTNPIPLQLCDPVTCEALTRPVITSTGHTYNLKTLEEWTSKHDTCPMTNVNIRGQKFYPNLDKANAFEEWAKNLLRVKNRDNVFKMQHRAMRKIRRLKYCKTSPNCKSLKRKTSETTSTHERTKKKARKH